MTDEALATWILSRLNATDIYPVMNRYYHGSWSPWCYLRHWEAVRECTTPQWQRALRILRTYLTLTGRDTYDGFQHQ